MPIPGPGMMMGPPPPGGPGAHEGAHADDIKGTLLRMMGYFFREKALTAGLFFSVLAGVIFGIIAPTLQANVIDNITGKYEGDFFSLLVCMLLGYLLYALCSLFQGWMSARLSVTIVRRLREELFGRVLDLPIRYLDRHSHGDMMSRMTNDIEAISMTTSEALPSLFSGVLTIIGTAIAMFWHCWQLTLLSFLTVGLTLLATRFMAMVMRKYSRRRQILLGRVNGIVEESVSGYKTVVAFQHQSKLQEDFAAASDELTSASIKMEALAGSMGPIMNGIGNLGFVIIAAFGGLFAMNGMISIGVISAFIVYARQFSRPIGDIAMVYGSVQSAVAAAERVFCVLDEAQEAMEGQDLDCGDDSTVTFEDVDFSYEPSTPVLKGFNLKVEQGCKVALVGATGSGKTTVVNLLERFYDIDAGCIRIGGTDIAGVGRENLRSQVAIVLQETMLFADTVLANLRYANPDATRQEVEQALEMCHAAGFVHALPQGLDTVLSSGGENLSSGQRQLLSIARAFVADPRILILDEATSNVDTRTEREVQDAMQRVMANRTSIVIAHRLSTIRDADLIVVMDAGTVCESGTHEQLLAAKGRYYQLYMSQFAGQAI